MRFLLTAVLALCIIALTTATLFALWTTNIWWVRMTDFPRLQYVIALVILLVALALIRPVSRGIRVSLGLIALVALTYNAIKLWPYFVTTGIETAQCGDGQQLSILVANVKLENRNAEALIGIVRDRNPDLFLALETTEWWDRQLSPLADSMPHTASQITGSYFGMHLFSRLELEKTEILKPVGQDTPAILTTVTLSSGDALRFFGIHPRPPHPGQPSTGRDAVLAWTGLEARDSDLPVAAAGDLNAVPWERTTTLMQRLGGLIDPRLSAGFLPTYDAQSWWMAWPLDQVLYQPQLDLVAMEVLPGFGSDHYPVEVSLCHRPAVLEPPEPQDGDLATAKQMIDAATEGGADSN